MADSTPLPPYIADVIDHCIEITLKHPDDFLKVKETLTRIGVASRKDRKLYQSCHILHKRGKYYVMHFKELHMLDGKLQQTNFTDDDRARRNTIANLLATWGLVELVDVTKSATPVVSADALTVLPFKEKPNWTLLSKYTVGKIR